MCEDADTNHTSKYIHTTHIHNICPHTHTINSQLQHIYNTLHTHHKYIQTHYTRILRSTHIPHTYITHNIHTTYTTCTHVPHTDICLCSSIHTCIKLIWCTSREILIMCIWSHIIRSTAFIFYNLKASGKFSSDKVILHY